MDSLFLSCSRFKIVTFFSKNFLVSLLPWNTWKWSFGEPLCRWHEGSSSTVDVAHFVENRAVFFRTSEFINYIGELQLLLGSRKVVFHHKIWSFPVYVIDISSILHYFKSRFLIFKFCSSLMGFTWNFDISLSTSVLVNPLLIEICLILKVSCRSKWSDEHVLCALWR